MELTICCPSVFFRGMKDWVLHQDDGISIVCEPEFIRIKVRVLRDGSVLCFLVEAITTTLLDTPVCGQGQCDLDATLPQTSYIELVQTHFLCVLMAQKKETWSFRDLLHQFMHKVFSVTSKSHVWSKGQTLLPASQQYFHFLSNKMWLGRKKWEIMRDHLAHEFKHRGLARK